MNFLIFTIFLIVYSYNAGAQRCIPLANSTCTGAANSGSTGPGCLAGTRWAYDPTNRVCTAFTYHGCGGNTNRYCSRVVCERRCIPTASPGVVVG
ncbi:kunitz-type serine protease inhibitor bitisilin-2-like [Bactrocera dorsalis]|uniref:Kunitz-type serine protease inhibitor bitisilin-2-like n=1 Tax=Bactrocera dorsalis TaxID=27457 RepID=A0ABM3JWN8_BACDO|nr:kunitz-type serine protease inhibitor bitisilin-2-like [Bactrocera dorsalis]